ncbi:hypothetical protein KZZ52_49900 [Dactylosporangium sp. AC04546]|uniref:hypothetical protein n=1 Tax=Dactylosporangium sp. AC04546 TaxID=2862460 RepID=UPI001EDF6A5B|nr:hypothetical protein [Dactylosporangium sp. AC04546]WVK82000.1 hypothetical protein KZZ52_49900 [Dactylosporangium sp. AC04546]
MKDQVTAGSPDQGDRPFSVSGPRYLCGDAVTTVSPPPAAVDQDPDRRAGAQPAPLGQCGPPHLGQPVDQPLRHARRDVCVQRPDRTVRMPHLCTHHRLVRVVPLEAKRPAQRFPLVGTPTGAARLRFAAVFVRTVDGLSLGQEGRGEFRPSSKDFYSKSGRGDMSGQLSQTPLAPRPLISAAMTVFSEQIQGGSKLCCSSRGVQL